MGRCRQTGTKPSSTDRHSSRVLNLNYGRVCVRKLPDDGAVRPDGGRHFPVVVQSKTTQHDRNCQSSGQISDQRPKIQKSVVVKLAEENDAAFMSEELRGDVSSTERLQITREKMSYEELQSFLTLESFEEEVFSLKTEAEPGSSSPLGVC
ncbi:hypothetical protein Q8A73_011358 [Channa argus]|nr:hypothetical protein Q8A73_011358 [Channa argus]